MSEVELLYDETVQRLRGRCRWAGPLVSLISLLPYEVVDERPQFLWDLAGELPPAALFAYLAPAIAGLLIVVAGIRGRRAASLGVAVLATMAGAAWVVQLGADAAAWDILSLPESIARRPQWAFVALALVSAGTLLAARPHARPQSRWVLGGGAALALLFYAWPTAGEAPISTIIRLIAQVDGELPLGVNAGFVFLAVLALWPGLMAGLGLLHLRWPPATPFPVLAIASLYGLPALLGTMMVQALMNGAGWSLFAFMGSLAVLCGVLALLAGAFEALVEGLFAPLPATELPPGVPARRALGLAAGALAAVVAVQSVLAMPPSKGVEWVLQPPGAASDQVFGELVPAWDEARLSWDRRVRAGSSAQAHVEVKGAARALVEAARSLDGRLAEAFDALTRESSADLALAGRRWMVLVADVNEASRQAGLPYYLDPTAMIFQTGDGLRRHFRVRPYRIERVGRFEADGEPVATLHVTRLDGPPGQDQRLGFSRDVQPFALVSVGEIDGFDLDLGAMALERPPVCAREAADSAPGGALERCGAVLVDTLRRAGGDLEPTLVALTERHELQHQLDGPHLPIAARVLGRLGRFNERTQQRVNRELSAYLAEMTAPGPAAPHLGLVHVYRFLLTADRGTEVEVAALALAALADLSLAADRDLDRRALADAFDRLAALSADELRARVVDTWGDLYDTDLPAVVPAEAE